MLPSGTASAGRLPIGLSKSRNTPMCAIESWIEDPARQELSSYAGKEKHRVDALMEQAHEEIALLRLRLLRLTVGGIAADPVGSDRDVVRVLDRQIMYLRGRTDPVDESILLDGLERAREELLRHRSLL